MTDSTAESIFTTTTGLLTYYCYVVENQGQDALLDCWLGDYSLEWVRLALIESLYRGRYKTISVGGLLADWKRKGQPIYHFNREFEALICHKFPQIKFKQEETSFDQPAKPTSLGIDREQTLEPLSSSSTPEASGTLSQRGKAPATELNLQDVESGSHRNLKSETHLISDKLLGFVAEIVGDKTLPSNPKEQFQTLISDHEFDASPRRVEEDKKPQKAEIAPIDQFVPNREVSEHYQKLVKIVSNRSTPYH